MTSPPLRHDGAIAYLSAEGDRINGFRTRIIATKRINTRQR